MHYIFSDSFEREKKKVIFSAVAIQMTRKGKRVSARDMTFLKKTIPGQKKKKKKRRIPIIIIKKAGFCVAE